MDKTAMCEQLHNSINSGKSAVLFARRLYISYRATGDQSQLVKALGAMEAAARRDNCDIAVVTELAFLLYETGYTRDVAEVVTALLKNKNWLKEEAPLYFAAICAIDALLKQRRNKDRAANKKYDEIERVNAGAGGAQPALYAILGALNVRLGALRGAIGYLNAAYAAGCRSSIMFLAAFEYYKEVDAAEADAAFLMPAVIWGFAHGLDLSAIINNHKRYLVNELAANPDLAARLYASFGGDTLLKAVCDALIAANDTSLRAYYFYREAEVKQLMFAGLNRLLVLAAYQNDLADISRFSMARFLENDLAGEGNEGLTAFLYALIVSDDKYVDVLKAHDSAVKAFARKRLGRADYFETPAAILTHFLVNSGAAGEERALVKRAADLVWEKLFVVSVATKNPKARHIWVMNKYTRSGCERDIIGGKAEITVCGAIDARFFSAEFRTIISDKEAGAVFTTLVSKGGAALYRYFFSHGYYNHFLAAALLDDCAANPDETDAKLLEKAASEQLLTSAARNKARAALGAFYAGIDEARAAEWYADVDESILDAIQQEHMLTMLIKTGRFDRAAALLLKNSDFMRESIVFAAVKKLAGEDDYKDDMANEAYELLLKSRFDRQLLGLTIDRYHGSHDDWLALSHQLTSINAEDLRVDERVLDNAILIRRCDAPTLKVFARMVNRLGESELTKDFLGYITYEILINGINPGFEAIEAIERLYAATGDRFAAYALTAVYVGNKISNARSEEIIADCANFAREDGCLFPIFKHIKDKKITAPYIDKNAAFCKAAEAGGEVRLFYRFDGEERFTESPMRRGRFGLWFLSLPLFYGENAEYYYKETTDGGSLQTPRDNVSNADMPSLDDTADVYELLNGAGLCEQMFRYTEAEERIGRILAERPPIIAELM